MFIQAIIGAVKSLGELLEKFNAQDKMRFMSTGTFVYQGDYLALISGEAYVQFIKGFPEVLSLNHNVYLDGQSPVLESGTFDISKALINEAIDKNIDISLLMGFLNSTGISYLNADSNGYTMHSDFAYFADDPLVSYSLNATSFAMKALLTNDDSIHYNPISTVFVPNDIQTFTSAVLFQDISVPLDGTISIFGNVGPDFLYGDSGDNTINGGLGNDMIQGGSGSDFLTGGGGVDTFMWISGDNGLGVIDTITDFKANPVLSSIDASVLNLADLLQGEHLNPNSLDGYLSVTKSVGDTVIAVDPDGNFNFANPTETIVLAGVDLTANNTISSYNIINTLITNGNLITDQ